MTLEAPDFFHSSSSFWHGVWHDFCTFLENLFFPIMQSTRRFLIPVLMLWIVFQFLTPSTILYAQTSNQAEIGKLVQQWHVVITAGDLDAVSAQYADDAVFFPTFVNITHTAARTPCFFHRHSSTKSRP